MSGILIYRPLPFEDQMSLGKRNTAGFFIVCSIACSDFLKSINL